MGVPDAPPAATRQQRAPSFRRPLLSKRGEALWERDGAGSGSQGAASCSSDSARGVDTWVVAWLFVCDGAWWVGLLVWFICVDPPLFVLEITLSLTFSFTHVSLLCVFKLVPVELNSS